MPNYGSLGRIVTGLQARKREILKKGTGHGKWCETQGGHGESRGFIAMSCEQINAVGKVFVTDPVTYDLRFPGICFISRFWQVGEMSSLHCTVNVYTIRFSPEV